MLREVGHWNHDTEDCVGEVSEDTRALLGTRECQHVLYADKELGYT